MPNNGAYNNQAASPAERNIGPVGLTRAPVASQVTGLLFEENFDNLPDWTSNLHDGTEASLPGEFNYGRFQGDWSPSTGHPDRHETVEILASNTDKARGGTGKSYVKWREGRAWDQQNNHHTDSMLVKYFGQDYNELYGEFYIRFSPEMTAGQLLDKMGDAKLFRILHHNGNPAQAFDFFGETNSPKMIWDVNGGPTYGLRNKISFYGRGPVINSIEGLGGLVNQGDWIGSYLNDLGGMRPDGSDAALPDKINGGFITPDRFSVAMMNQIFGSGDTWTKVAFYVKMNSAPGVADGQIMQWIDGQRILFNDKIPWVLSGYDMVGWNYVAIGGNDLIKSRAEGERYEEWYAIDDLKVYTSIPDGVEH